MPMYRSILFIILLFDGQTGPCLQNADSYSPDAWYMSVWISFYKRCDQTVFLCSIVLRQAQCRDRRIRIDQRIEWECLERIFNANDLQLSNQNFESELSVISEHTWTRRPKLPMSFTHQNTMWTVSIELSRVPITPLYKFTASFVVVDWLFQLNISMFCWIECIYTELFLRKEMSVLELLSRSNTNDVIFIFIHIECVPTLFINQWIWMRWL